MRMNQEMTGHEIDENISSMCVYVRILYCMYDACVFMYVCILYTCVYVCMYVYMYMYVCM